MISYYRISARTKKWTVRVAFHMVDFVVAAGWIFNRRVEAASLTPKKDLTDLLSYKTQLATHLLLGQTEEEENEVDNDIRPLPGLAPRRTQPTPLPLHAERTHKAKHMPEVADSTIRHRCRLPGCTASSAHFFLLNMPCVFVL